MKNTKNIIRLITPMLLVLWGCESSLQKEQDKTQNEGVVFLKTPSGVDLALADGEAGLIRGASLENAVNSEQEPVQISWELKDRKIPSPQIIPHLAQSRQFQKRIDATDLAQGVDIPLHAPGAVIKISPFLSTQQNPKALAIDDLTLTDATGRVHAAADVAELGATSDEFRKGEFPFAPGTTLLKTQPELGTGMLKLGLRNTATPPAYDVLLHVYEPNSDIVLALQSKSDAYLQDQNLEVIAEWQGNITPKSDRIQGHVIDPFGTRTAIQLMRQEDGKFIGNMPLGQTKTRPGALWEIEVDAEATTPLGSTQRTVKTAFAYSLGTASLDSRVTLSSASSPGDLHLGFGVNVGSPGRYAITGVLYGTAENGEMVPFMVSQSAATIEAGKQTIELTFEKADLAGVGLSAPYEIRDLRLVDQTRFGLLHRQGRAVVLPSLPQ